MEKSRKIEWAIFIVFQLCFFVFLFLPIEKALPHSSHYFLKKDGADMIYAARTTLKDMLYNHDIHVRYIGKVGDSHRFYKSMEMRTLLFSCVDPCDHINTSVLQGVGSDDLKLENEYNKNSNVIPEVGSIEWQAIQDLSTGSLTGFFSLHKHPEAEAEGWVEVERSETSISYVHEPSIFRDPFEGYIKAWYRTEAILTPAMVDGLDIKPGETVTFTLEAFNCKTGVTSQQAISSSYKDGEVILAAGFSIVPFHVRVFPDNALDLYLKGRCQI